MDIPLDIRYYSKVKKMIQNPTVEAFMILPEKVFQDFNFDKFIFVKHKDLSGYFMVNKIENYKDGNTPVRVDLLYID